MHRASITGILVCVLMALPAHAVDDASTQAPPRMGVGAHGGLTALVFGESHAGLTAGVEVRVPIVEWLVLEPHVEGLVVGRPDFVLRAAQLGLAVLVEGGPIGAVRPHIGVEPAVRALQLVGFGDDEEVLFLVGGELVAGLSGMLTDSLVLRGQLRGGVMMPLGPPTAVVVLPSATIGVMWLF